MPTRRAVRPVKKKGFSAKTFKGMSKKRMDARKGSFGVRVPLKESTTVPIQFLEGPEDATEFEVHAFQEDGQWWFVPCAGDNCPLCLADDDTHRRTSYRFLLNVYNLESKKVQILEGPQQLAQAIFYRYERKPANFMKRTYDITRLPTTPTSYQFELGEDEMLSASELKKMKKLDTDEYLIGEMKRYYGDELPEEGPSSLDDDEDEDDLEDDDIDEDDDLEDDDDLDEDEDDDDPDEDEDDDDLDDDDLDDDLDDDDDLDEDEDEDEDDDDPPPRRRGATKKAASKKAPAKRVPARKAPAKKAPAKRTATRGRR